MATETVFYRAPTLHYVTSADDVTEWRPSVVVGRGHWAASQRRDHRDCGPRQRPTPIYAAGTARGELSSCRRKLSVDDSPSWRPVAAAAGGSGPSRRRVIAASSSDDAASSLNVDDWTYERRRSSAWSPLPPPPLSRTLSEHTLDRSAHYRAAAACRDDLLDDCSVTADALEAFLSPPRIAPVSGQLSLVCIHHVTITTSGF